MRRSCRVMVPPDSCFHSQTALDEFFPAQIVTGQVLAIELPLDHHLRGDAGVVGARLPQRVVAAHAMVACQRIHQRVLECVSHVQAAGDIRRRDHDAVGRGVSGGLEIALIFPGLVPALLDGVRIVGLVH